MTRSLFSGATALALLGSSALAQEAASGDQPMRDAAIQSAEGVGIQGVSGVEGAFVLQGISPTGMPILMIVGPAGELIAIAMPLVAPAAAAGGETGTGAEAAGAEAEPEAGEPAESGFMATQTQPASPQMWDPAMIESAMQSLGSEGGGAATQTPQGGAEAGAEAEDTAEEATE